MSVPPVATKLPPWLAAARWAHRHLLNPALRFVLPACCFACGEELGRWQHLGACLSCWAAIRPLRPPFCSGCGLPLPSGTDLLGPARDRCGRCLVRSPALDAVRAAVPYDTVARRFLLRVKIGRRRELLRPLARRLSACVRASGMSDGCTLVAPVASNPWTDFRRGFSPSRDLARMLARETEIRLRSRLIVRRPASVGVTKRLSARRRVALASRAFRVGGAARGERVLLVDDVMTTGASADACARLLRRAGAREVRLAVWARTLPGQSGTARAAVASGPGPLL